LVWLGCLFLSRKSMTLQLTVPNMSCSVCANTITKALQAVDANASVQADPTTKLVNVETQASETAIKEALAAAGYPVA
jgi:copper chaperone